MDGGKTTQTDRRRTDDGVALVEFALILPVFAMLLLGLITGGIALNDKQQITHATREGARYAATVPAGQPFTSGTWATNVRDVIVARSDGALTAGDVCVSLVEGNNPTTAVTEGTSGPTYHSTAPSGAACITGQSYPVVAGDSGRRAQVTATRNVTIELGLFGELTPTVDVEATARSEG